MEYDNILKQIGEFGPFQRRVLIIICLVNFPHVFNTLGYVFWAARLEHWCHVDRPTEFENVSEELWKNITIPSRIDTMGELDYDSCYQYPYADNLTIYSEDLRRYDNMHQNVTESSNDDLTGCKSWDYDTHQYKSSIVTQFRLDNAGGILGQGTSEKVIPFFSGVLIFTKGSPFTLVCDRQWLISTTQSVYFGSRIFGAIAVGWLADRYGRRIMLLACVLFEFISSFVIAFAPNITMFIILRGLCAAFSNGQYQTANIMVFELVGPAWRVFAGVCFMLVWALGYMVLPLIAYLISDHFILMLSLSLIGIVVFCLLLWILPESPRWLLVNRKQSKALSLIKQMARVNRQQYLREEGFDIILKTEEEMRSDTNVNREKFSDIFSSRYVWKITVVQCFIWLACASVYYGLSINPSNFGGNDYLNVFISGAVEVPAYLLVHLTFGRFGRQWPLAFMTLLAGCSLFLISFIPAGLSAVTVTLVSVGKFAVTCAFGMIYIYTPELYPTSIRSLTIGICSTAARIGSALAPFATDLSVYYPGAPFLIFGIMATLSSALVFTLPETKGISLPQTLEDCMDMAHQPNVIKRCLKRRSKKSNTK